MPFVANSVKLHLNDYILITINMKHHIDINIEYWPTLHQKSQMLHRLACEEYSKELGHDPLQSAGDG